MARADVASEIEVALRDAADAAEVDPAQLAGIGVGSPGTIDDGERHERAQPARLGGHVPAGGDARARRSAPQVSVGNDVQVATDAEFRLGAGRLYCSLLGVFWGTGVGGGLILDGRPWTGRGGAGEIGHMVVEIDGAHCTCGRRGCMEAYAGRAAMEVHARQPARGEGTQDRPVQADGRARTRLA